MFALSLSLHRSRISDLKYYPFLDIDFELKVNKILHKIYWNNQFFIYPCYVS